MTHIETMKQALEALEVANSCIDDYYLPKEKAWLPEIEQAIASLRQAIAEAEKQKPVIDKSAAIRISTALGWEPKREWVGLDYHDKKKFSSWLDHKSDDEVFTAIEAKLKEMNT